MKNIYIGDIHGRTEWKQIVNAHIDADNIVFIGDYFDAYEREVTGQDELDNLQEILEFKKQQEQDPAKRVYLLIGNHDHHYWPGVLDNGGTSRYRYHMAAEFARFFKENANHFQMAVIVNDRLCSHAGVSSVFLEDTGYWTETLNTGIQPAVDDYLNRMFTEQPNEFKYEMAMGRNADSFKMFLDPSGDNVEQSPIWIRPLSLLRSNKNSFLKTEYVQIVGHTRMRKIDIDGNATGGRYFFIDALEAGQYLIDDTGTFSVGMVN
jgi:hypothetical protein